MCGIVGALRCGTFEDSNNPNDMLLRKGSLLLAANILEATEKRGPDATGVSALFEDGNFLVQKMGVPAKDFMTRFGGDKKDFQGFMRIMREYEANLRIFAAHCRKSSVGNSYDNKNNHPIRAGKIIGMHNGTLKNHELIFEKLAGQRDGDVDSEAIFRLLEHYSSGGTEPFTMEMVRETLMRLEGTFSIIAYNVDNPYQVVVGRDGRPAEFCLIRPLNTVLIASEKTFLEGAIFRYNQMAALFDEELPRIKSKDVQFELLSIDQYGIFDLTQEVGADTKIADLLTTDKLPLIGQRKWKNPTKAATSGSTNTYSGGTQRGNTTASKTGTAGTASKKNHSATGGQGAKSQAAQGSKAPGRVWSSSLGAYVDAKGVGPKETKVVDVEKKSIAGLTSAFNQVKSENDDPFGKKESQGSVSTRAKKEAPKKAVTEEKSVGTVERFRKSDTGKNVKALPVDKGGKPKVIKQSETLSGKDTKANEAKEVILAQKAAVEAAKTTLNRLTSEDELAAFLDAELINLKQLALPALSNRIVKKHFVDMFVAGWLAKAKAAGTEGTSRETSSLEKELAVRKQIRVLKHVVKALSSCNESETPLHEWAEVCAGFHRHQGTELTLESLKNVFNDGDFRGSQKLTALKNELSK